MPKLIVNGAGLTMRLVEVELSRLKLDAENPRLHSAYLTHELPVDPTQKQIEAVLRSLPEFRPLVESIAHNDGCFAPPLVSADFRVLEGNRRGPALRSLRAEQPIGDKLTRVTVHQLASSISPTQEKAIRARFHLDYVESRVNTHPSQLLMTGLDSICRRLRSSDGMTENNAISCRRYLSL